jgi:hypothetical protein
VVTILGPRDTILPGTVTPSATVHNYGVELESFRVFFRITGGYSDSVSVSLPGGRDTTLSFAAWTATSGAFATRCSTGLASDVNRSNDTLGGSAVVLVVNVAGWTRMLDVNPGTKRKNVKDGAALAYGKEGVGGLGSGFGDGGDTDFVYAFKGNNTYEFYRYNVALNTWLTQDSVPAYNQNHKKKAVKKGSTLVQATNDKLYATKGNNTYDFWEYDPTKSTGFRWTQKLDVPTGSKAMREGAGAVAVLSAGHDTDYVHLLKGSGTYEFYRCSIEANTWETMPIAPAGVSGRTFKNGSSLTYDGGDTIYCLKGSYNEFFAYSISRRTWATLETMPKVAPPGTKKTKVKDGSGTAYARRIVYGLKGANTNEFWTYFCDSHRWYHGTDITTGPKKVKDGGALVASTDGNACMRSGATTRWSSGVTRRRRSACRWPKTRNPTTFRVSPQFAVRSSHSASPPTRSRTWPGSATPCHSPGTSA